MKKYQVLIEETLGTTIIVEAENEDQADQIAEAVYNNSDITLGAEHLNNTVIGGEYTEELPEDDNQTPDYTPEYLNK